MLALGFGFGPIFQKAGAGNYMQFLVPGIISMSILFMAFSSGIEVIWDRQFGFLKETLVAPASRFQIMFGKTLGGATVAVLQGIIVLLLSLFVGFKLPGAACIGFGFCFYVFNCFAFCCFGNSHCLGFRRYARLSVDYELFGNADIFSFRSFVSNR